MLRKFKITIDGKEYLVEMEEIGGTQPAPQPSVQPAAPVEESSVQVEAKKEESNTQKAEPASDEAMTAPMPGTVLKILVNVGDSVVENQPVLILEAMKMENEIVASHSGTIEALHVNKGDAVNSGDALLTIN
ncbi:MAG TPA: acetyl-CoA carboxylase biotin carboxyl carrier protein subunit [Tetragenococcus sp.]|nr:acetyl-CoA carboxylase biotin carboxyl carrier protein subunit [Tetragenococcus sp.]